MVLPMCERTDITELLNRSELVEGFMPCYKSQKLKLYVQSNVILMDLHLSMGIAIKYIGKKTQ